MNRHNFKSSSVTVPGGALVTAWAYLAGTPRGVLPLLAEVVQFRLQTAYGAESRNCVAKLLQWYQTAAMVEGGCR